MSLCKDDLLFSPEKLSIYTLIEKQSIFLHSSSILRITQLGIESTSFKKKFFKTSRKFWIETLKEERKSVVLVKHEFENRAKSVVHTFLAFVFHQYAMEKTNW